MAKRDDIRKKYEKRHLNDIKKYQGRLQRIYYEAIDKIFSGSASVKLKNETFDITKYPQLNKLVDNVLAEFQEQVVTLLVNGVTEQWELAEQSIDDVIQTHLGDRAFAENVKAAIFSRNTAAMAAFMQRAAGKDGLKLSERVWRYSSQFRSEIEQGLYTGISEGMPAAKMASEQKKYLREPNKLFRRVRNADKKLVLSKAAREYHPGQGIYRSSFKNALRLTRSETNMSYRTADGERYSRTKFILGFEVRLSANHPKFDICDHMTGKYPSNFKFVGWHPQCICYTVPILPSMEEYDAYEEALLAGRGDGFQFKNPVKKEPAGFWRYVTENRASIKRWKSKPYWVRDNKINI
ncbi:hypothetical protein [Parapedobacter indicus]|uniref:Phage Mu protein F like protein n=1 Tax=Parapedobacter indicus TaxID=1477437 RepID=A0A1I3V2M6_9SPHI|nr:hypothetical protein [Parapedobacter indicus]PPK98989.1 hypothetical protein CLV26_11518 [Parapedobacter indicus]SFJ89390.1 hypothetical protein SAMN05444682_115159 [Parapedobacter indicus]